MESFETSRGAFLVAIDRKKRRNNSSDPESKIFLDQLV